jgi:tRNA (guanine37-N1)-methyltransferase
MRFDILTIFPKMFDGPFDESIVKRARDAGLISIAVHNIRDYAVDKHRSTDDYPFGGGAGMVMKPEPVFAAAEDVLSRVPVAPSRRALVLLSAAGRPFNQREAERLAALDHLLLICGRYEGVDERVAEHLATDQLSVGDYVLTGGELPAMIIVDAVTRLIPGVLSCAESAVDESYSSGLLEYPQYTRPAVFRGWSVPEVLLSGNHAAVARWRRERALHRTAKYRPDLLASADLSRQDRHFLEQLAPEVDSPLMEAGADAENDTL